MKPLLFVFLNLEFFKGMNAFFMVILEGINTTF